MSRKKKKLRTQLWISRLRDGSRVYVRKPWEDGGMPGGRLCIGVVRKRWPELLVVEYDGRSEAFYSATLKSGPYAHLEYHSKEIIAEYKQRQAIG